jgi:hypothetical protein
MTLPTLRISPGRLTLGDLQAIRAGGVSIEIDPAARQGIAASAAVVERAAAGQAPVYGVNTGFGKLASTRISEEDLDTLQLNLIRSHSVGVGEPLQPAVVRLMMSFGEMENIADKVKIVVNRVGLESGQITLKKACDTIGREIFWQLPNDYRTMIEVRNNGVPLVEQAPKAAITQSFLGLTAALTDDCPPEVSGDAEKKSGFGRLFKLLSTNGPAK